LTGGVGGLGKVYGGSESGVAVDGTTVATETADSVDGSMACVIEETCDCAMGYKERAENMECGRGGGVLKVDLEAVRRDPGRDNVGKCGVKVQGARGKSLYEPGM